MTRLDRRSAILAFAGLVLANRREALAADGKQDVAIEPWVVAIPGDWLRSTDPRPALYYEAPDGACGCYVKVYQPPRPMDPKAMAEQLQSIYERAFRKQGKGWEVRRRSGGLKNSAFQSTMDLYDFSNRYRIASFVLAKRTEAFQVTVHDYDCPDYDKMVSDFDTIRDSMRWRGDAV